MSDNSYHDSWVRLAAFNWLEEQTARHGEVLPWQLLAQGFQLDGRRVPLVSQQGIFKPAVLEDVPLSLRTSPGGPYDDHFDPDGTLRYAYRGTDPNHHQNVWVRNACARQVPMVYCVGITAGRYLVVWPVFVVGDDPGALTFSIAADDRKPGEIEAELHRYSTLADSPEERIRRRYATREVRQRLHQQTFRERVLSAYHEQCAICSLRHRELLEAAHIEPDAEPAGEPMVSNGLSLCRLHHGAFDNYFIGIRPDCTVEVRPSILEETDGPMLRVGLQGLQNQRIWTPRSAHLKPDRELLERRYELFRKTG